MSVARALGQALAKTAQDMVQLPLQVAGLNERRMTLADLPEALEDRALLAVIEGPGEALGLIALPSATLSALIEVQTMGRLGAHAPPPRKPTRTDASMSAGVLDGILTEFEEALAEMSEITWAGGFRYASFLDDPRPLGLLLEDCAYRVFDVQLALGSAGEREGGFLLALPAVGRGPGPRRAGALPLATGAAAVGASATEAAAVPEAGDWPDQMARSVMGTKVTLEAVLHRVTLPLQAVLSFQPGAVLPVPMAALESLSIEGAGRRKIARARLGQSRGFRAARLVMDDADGALDEAEPVRPAAAATPAAAKSAAKPAAIPARSHARLPAGGADEPDLPEAMAMAELPPIGEALDFGKTNLDDVSEVDAEPILPLKIGSAF